MTNIWAIFLKFNCFCKINHLTREIEKVLTEGYEMKTSSMQINRKTKSWE